MVWAYLDDTFPEHPKTIAAGGDAAWLFVCALCWSRRHLTGGRVPKDIVPRISDRKNTAALARRLVDVGYWDDNGNSYTIHDYDHWNGEDDAVRARRREKAVNAAKARWGHAPSNAQASAEHVPEQSPEQCSEQCSSNAPPRAGARGPYQNPKPIQPPVSKTHDPSEPDGWQPSNRDNQDIAYLAGELTKTSGVAWTTTPRIAMLTGEWRYGLQHLGREELIKTILSFPKAANVNGIRSVINKRSIGLCNCAEHRR